jgi:hypothetical protein
VLHRHCADAGRDPADVTVTQLSTALDGTAEDHAGRFRALAEAGVQTAIVNFPDLGETGPVDAFADVIQAFG